MKELAGLDELNPAVAPGQLVAFKLLPGSCRTLLSLLAFELGKWRFGISRPLGLPFPIHGAFMCTPWCLIVEHSEVLCRNEYVRRKAKAKSQAGKFQVNKTMRLKNKVSR
jgi:hypothetical protein